MSKASSTKNNNYVLGLESVFFSINEDNISSMLYMKHYFTMSKSKQEQEIDCVHF